MVDLTNPVDGDFFETSIAEVDKAFGEPVIIKRWTGKSGGSQAQGVAAGNTYTNIKTTAVISELDAREINYPNSIFAAGDLKAEFAIEVKGAESFAGDQATAAKGADLVVYRGRDYRIIGTVNRVYLHNNTHYEAKLRRIG